MPNHSPLTFMARKLRANLTDAEIKFWNHVKQRQFRGLKFRRQTPVGPYVADYLCYEHHLIVEIDGGQHNDKTADLERTKFLESKGFRVMRFWNNDVLQNIEGVLETIAAELGLNGSPSPNPSLREGKKKEAISP